MRSSGVHSHSPTAMLEQVQERLDSMAQDCVHSERWLWEEMVRSTLVRVWKAAAQQKAQEAAAGQSEAC